jgi:5-methylthioadenosine/S-adenosylhomocysteine deaminase
VGVDLAAVRRTVEATVEHLKAQVGEEQWSKDMNPDSPSDEDSLDNPYQYTEYRSGTTRGAGGSVFEESGSALPRRQDG